MKKFMELVKTVATAGTVKVVRNSAVVAKQGILEVAKTTEAATSLVTVVPTNALKPSARDMEVEKDVALVDFQTTLAMELYDNAAAHFTERISDARKAQARNAFMEIADRAFDAYDEEDLKLSNIERASILIEARLVDAHRETVLDERKALAQNVYNMIMGVQDEIAIEALSKTLGATVEAAIESAPSAVAKTDEILNSLRDAAAMFEEKVALEIEDIQEPMQIECSETEGDETELLGKFVAGIADMAKEICKTKEERFEMFNGLAKVLYKDYECNIQEAAMPVSIIPEEILSKKDRIFLIKCIFELEGQEVSDLEYVELTHKFAIMFGLEEMA